MEQPKPAGESPPPFVTRLVNWASTALVVAALGGFAYWGHHTDWRFVPASAPADQAVEPPLAVVEVDPDSPRGRWCAEHGVHGCPACQPAVTEVAKSTEGRGDRRRALTDALRLRPRAANDENLLPPGARLRLLSAEAAERAGIDSTPAWEASVTEAVTANGEVSFDPGRVAKLSSRVAGTVARVMKRVGDPVAAGDVLLVVDSVEVGKAKSEFQQSLLRTQLRARTLANLRAGGTAISARQVQEAEAEAREAESRQLASEQALANLGLAVKAAEYDKLSTEQVTAKLRALGLTPEQTPPGESFNLLPLRSPLAGVVLARDAVAGEVVDVGKVLVTVVDPSVMWVTLAVRSEDVSAVSVGRPMRFRADAVPNEVAGRVTWVGRTADETTRAVPVRGEFANTDGALRASGFGVGRVILREEPTAVLVPAEAVVDEGRGQIVFVRDKEFLKDGGPKVFHVRTVRTGVREGANVEILAGVEPGEVVAAKGVRALVQVWRDRRTVPQGGPAK